MHLCQICAVSPFICLHPFGRSQGHNRNRKSRWEVVFWANCWRRSRLELHINDDSICTGAPGAWYRHRCTLCCGLHSRIKQIQPYRKAMVGWTVSSTQCCYLQCLSPRWRHATLPAEIFQSFWEDRNGKQNGAWYSAARALQLLAWQQVWWVQSFRFCRSMQWTRLQQWGKPIGRNFQSRRAKTVRKPYPGHAIRVPVQHVTGNYPTHPGFFQL